MKLADRREYRQLEILGRSRSACENHDHLFPFSPAAVILLHLLPASMLLGLQSYMLQNDSFCKENTRIVSASRQQFAGSLGQTMEMSPFASLVFYLICFSYLLLPIMYTYNNNNDTKSTLTTNKYTVLLSVILQ